MSAYHYVFVHPASADEDVLADLSTACGAPLHEARGKFIDYSVKVGKAAIELELSHEYDEDQGIPLDRYRWVFTVRDFDRDQARQEATARKIFQRLADTGRYWLVLVFDLQRFVASAAPAEAEPDQNWPPKATA